MCCGGESVLKFGGGSSRVGRRYHSCYACSWGVGFPRFLFEETVSYPLSKREAYDD